MEKVKKFFRVVTALAVVALLAVLFFQRGLFDKGPADEEEPGRSSPSPSASSPSRDNVELELTNMISRKGGTKHWELKAGRIKVNQVTRKGDASDISCMFYDKKGKTAMTFNASGADIDLKTESLMFRGRVKGSLTSGEKLEVAKLKWDGKKKRIFGYGRVTITKGTLVLTGTDLTGDPSRNYFEILRDVQVLWKPGPL
ncbi:MAG: LPS export ABC transporter periplasmic protein LptC [Candidatus Eremiobacteraeota bacterium]|nr:LPS export ABC transporter periplasmic protein LptC [Candidatus Eremiobacteraeota bacterium]